MKTMTIFIDGQANDRDSLATAVAFCRCLDGRLGVVHARQDVTVIASDGQAFVDDARDLGVLRAAAKAAYDEVCGKLPFAHWQASDEFKTEAINRYGLLSDVVILERVSAEAGAPVLALNTALFETPGPVLVTPPRSPATIGRSVAVAWSPSIQSARALRSALPILAQAESVTTIVNAEDNRIDRAALARYLDAHGVRTAYHAFDGARLTARGRGRTILAAAEASAADLLVMGAYGENRLAALVGLGRATQKIVSATRIPALVQR